MTTVTPFPKTESLIRCPQCGAGTCVGDSRASGSVSNAVRRRRWCENGHRFTTVEVIDGTVLAGPLADALLRMPKGDLRLVAQLVARLSGDAAVAAEDAEAAQ